MRIAMLSTPFVPVPPPAYGGTELVVSELLDALRLLGHTVTLYTTGETTDPDARVRYRQPVWPPDPYTEIEHATWALRDIAANGSVDVVHTHGAASLPLRRFCRAPFVYTIHHLRSDAMTA